MRLLPKPLRDFHRFDFVVLPPSHFVAGLVQLPVMPTAERHGELIADFQANAARLRKSQMMWVARLPTTDQARLRCDEL